MSKKVHKKLPTPVKWVFIVLAAIIVVALGYGAWFLWGPQPKESRIAKPTEINHVSIHDPSIVDGRNGDFYIFGTHRVFAKSNNLMNWQLINNNNVQKDYPQLFKVGAKWSATGDSTYDVVGNTWAPDVIYNPHMRRWLMYFSINGANYNSSIACLTAKKVNGPYKYKGTVVYSGFDKISHPVRMTDFQKVTGNKNTNRYLKVDGTWNPLYGTNAIDPCVFFDKKGQLWMTYGSWFGGIFALKLDNWTGLRDYHQKYALKKTATNGKASDPYLGIRIAGGLGSSGEGSYVRHIGKYYYLFVSYGYLDENGGYNIRVFRSKNPTGPYKDSQGHYATYTNGVGINNAYGTIGDRLMSNYVMKGMTKGELSQGHNSVLVHGNQYFNVYHTRFDDGTENFETRVHQMFMAPNGWLVEAPFEYKGEKLGKKQFAKNDIEGSYEFVYHDPRLRSDNEADTGSGFNVIRSSTIKLNANGKITGAVDGSWTINNKKPEITLKFNGQIFKGVLFKQKDDSEAHHLRLCFSAISNKGIAIWGAKGTGLDNYQATNLKNGRYRLVNEKTKTTREINLVNKGNSEYLLYTNKAKKKILSSLNGFESGSDVSTTNLGVVHQPNQKIVRNTNGSYSILTDVSSHTQAISAKKHGLETTTYTNKKSQEWQLRKVN